MPLPLVLPLILGGGALLLAAKPRKRIAPRKGTHYTYSRLKNIDPNTERGKFLIAKANELIREKHSEPYGSMFFFERGDEHFMGKLEKHYHEPGGPVKPWGEHKGISLFIRQLASTGLATSPDAEKKRFVKCLRLLMAAMKRTQTNMSPREILAFQAGLHASHAEEAMMSGETARAEAHFGSLLEKMMRLRDE